MRDASRASFGRPGGGTGAGPLLAVPNVSEAREEVVRQIAGAASGTGARVLDVHSDLDHNRSVFTLAGQPGEVAEAVLALARAALAKVDLRAHAGVHPRVGVLDVAPVVYRDQLRRGAACAEALVLADLLADQLGLPVFLYGVLAGGRTRAELRRGGPPGLARRVASGELKPDFGPRRVNPEQGAVLVAARPPLVAFNLELQPDASLEAARAIAARIREGGDDGLTGVRAIGLWLTSAGRAQVSTNVEDVEATSLADVVRAVRRHEEVRECEQVGLAPAAAYRDFPAEMEVHGRRTLEQALGEGAPG